jgi:ABC-type bacteriocin/lantibiotic exporter with double-glycine peptidase domain
LLLSVNYEDRTWKGQTIKAGTIVTSWENLAKEIGLSVKQTRVAMDKLERSKEVARHATNKWQAVSLIKWDKLQCEEVEKGKQVDRQRATTKESKEIKNNYILDFDKFWTLYGKSTDKQKCLDKFVKLNEDEIKSIFETLPIYLLQTPDKKFRKNPLTYLNGKCWNDIDVNNPQVLNNPFNLPPEIID